MQQSNLQKLLIWACGLMLTITMSLTAVIYQNSVKTDEKISALLKEHSDKISSIEVRVAVIEQQLFFLGSEKKNKVACNFKQWLCVNNFLSKKKKYDAYDNEDDVPLFV